MLHYTGTDNYLGDLRELSTGRRQVSAHLLIGRKGETTQLVPFDTEAWHAGRGEWEGRRNMNKYSIGIEIANAGYLSEESRGFYTWYNHQIPAEDVTVLRHKNEQIHRPWHKFTQDQILAVLTVCTLLTSKYKIKEILGHDDVDPIRKLDPGPAFPLSYFQGLSWQM